MHSALLMTEEPVIVNAGEVSMVSTVMSTRWFLLFIVSRVAICPAQEFPSLRERFRDLPCLAPVIAKIDVQAPASLEEALSLPPNQLGDVWQNDELPSVSFPVTLAKADAQRWFNRGLSFYHLSAYLEAERCFRRAVQMEPNAPMPYWGLALANESTPRRAEVYIERAAYLAGRSPSTREERRWLQAYMRFYDPSGTPRSQLNPGETSQRRAALRDALQELAFETDSNREADAFLLRLLVLDAVAKNRHAGQLFPLDLLARRILDRNPDHPARVYRAMLWARLRPHEADQIGGELVKKPFLVAEYWRYAAQCFQAAGAFAEAISASETGLRAAHAVALRRHQSPLAQPAYASQAWEHVALLGAVGRIDEALQWLAHWESWPRLPQGRMRDQSLSEMALAKRRFFLFVRGERWQDLAEWEAAEEWEARAVGTLARTLGRRELKLESDPVSGEALFEKALKAGVSRELEERLKPWVRADRAVRQLGTAASRRLKTSDLAILPPEYKARLLLANGKQTEALDIAKQAVDDNHQAPLIKAQAMALHWSQADKDYARLGFTTDFRKQAALGDRSLAVWERLQPLAESVGLKGRWTLTGYEVNSMDLGPKHFPGASLPTAELLDPNGKSRSLSDLQGRKVILLFFVGVRCGFCLQQLKAFDEALASFHEHDVHVIGISPDAPEALAAFMQSDPPPLGFELLSDPTMTLFRQMQAYDDFEQEPMHGTVLVDEMGKIQWSFTAHEPFDQVGALLATCASSPQSK